MKSALIIGYGQIGKEIASQLSAAGVRTTVATRSAGAPVLVASNATGSGSHAEPGPASGGGSAGAAHGVGGEIAHVRTDAADSAQLFEAAAGSDVIFACAHAPYDSRQWAQVLPRLEATIMDLAKELDIPVIFPEGVYAFAGLRSPITESSPFAPVEEKGRIRQRLFEARSAHGAQTASVFAGDLIGETAQPKTSVVRMCISDRIRQGRRAVVPARSDVAHGITVIADLATAMIRAGQSFDAEDAQRHRVLLAPASNPSLAEIADFTHSYLGTPARKPIALPRWTTRVAGLVDRSMFELYELSPIWYEPCIIETGDFAAAVGTTRWQDGITAMLE